jgi:hypothetical protein
VDGMQVGVDVASGAVEVEIGGGDVEGFSRILSQRYGDLVSVTVLDGTIEPAANSRANDLSPHYGGARIRGVGRGACTSGFAVDLPGGPRIMTAAAHCFDAIGQSVVNGQGGPYRTVRARSHPVADAALIEGRTYHRFVWTGFEATRIVTSKRATPGWACRSVSPARRRSSSAAGEPTPWIGTSVAGTTVSLVLRVST